MKKKFLVSLAICSIVVSNFSYVIANALDNSKLLENTTEIKSEDLDNPSNISNFTSGTSNKRIVGFGDTESSIKELTETKLAFTKHLIEKEGYNIVFMENTLTKTNDLNNYVLGSNANIETLIGNQERWQNRSESFLEFVKWVKDYNQNVEDKKKVKFEGILFNDIDGIIYNISSYLINVDKDLGDEAATLLKTIANNIYIQQTSGNPLDLKEPMSKNKEIYNKIIANKDSYIKKSSEREYEAFKTYYNTISEYFDHSYYSQIQLAEVQGNFISNYIKENENNKGVLWVNSRNMITQPSNKAISISNVLKTNFNEQYFTIGTCYGEGNYLRHKSKDTTLIKLELTEGTFKDDDSKSIYSQLKDVNFNLMYLSLNKARNNQETKYTLPSLTQNIEIEKIESDFEKDFDGLIFVKVGTPEKNISMIKEKTEDATGSSNNTFLIITGVFIVIVVIGVVYERKVSK